MLLENEKVSLIQYAAFFGSVEIFKYLSVSGVKIENSIWKFAIHGENYDLINNIIESCPYPTNDQNAAEELLLTAIRCFNFDMFNYISADFESLIKKTELFDIFLMENSLKYRNYNIWSWKYLKRPETILPKYDCYLITEYILKNKDFDVEIAFTNSLMYSSYDFINLIDAARNNKKPIKDVDFDDIKEYIEKGKASVDAKDKIMLFIKAYNLGLNTKEKYNECYRGKSQDDDFTRFLEICDGKDLPPIVELMNAFEVEIPAYQQQPAQTSSSSAAIFPFQTPPPPQQCIQTHSYYVPPPQQPQAEEQTDGEFIDYIISKSGYKYDLDDRQIILNSFHLLSVAERNYYKRIKDLPEGILKLSQIQSLCNVLSGKENFG